MSDSPETKDRENEGPGLPGLRTWRSVYLLVLASFALWVVLLLILTRLYA